MKRFKTLQVCLAFIMLILSVFFNTGCGSNDDTNHQSPAKKLISVEVTSAKVSIPIGVHQQFIAAATYDDGTSTDVTASSSWTSGATGVATVNGTSGLATGVTEGTAVITADFDGKSGSETLTVTAATLSSIKVTPATATIAIGVKQTFVATGTYSDGTSHDISNSVTWSSGATGVATVVSITGVATGLSAGAATITANLDGESGSATLTVLPASVKLTSIKVTPLTASVPMGVTQRFVATAFYSNGYSFDVSNNSKLMWSSSATGVATVVSPGIATGRSIGTTTITATLICEICDPGPDIFGTATLTVTAATLRSIAVTPKTATVPIGVKQTFVATGTYSDGTSHDISNIVTWSSGDTGIATVVSPGVATGVSAGAAHIIATSGALSDFGTLTVTDAILRSIAVTPKTATVAIGGKQTFVATGTYSYGPSQNISDIVSWSSGDTNIATVVSPGVATGVLAGAANIIATWGALSDFGILTVTAPVTPPLGPPLVDLGTAENFVILTKAGITDVPTSVITGNIGTWPISGATIGVTCSEVNPSKIYDREGAYTGGGAADTTCRVTNDTLLSTAVGDMGTAYTAAAGAPAGTGTFLNVGAGTVAGKTLVAGVYTWGSNVTITTNLILNGGPTDVWIFQITGTLDMSPNMTVLLTGGALPQNIFWQVADVVTLGTNSHFEGIILAKTKIAMNTGASINGRLLAQTEVTLQQNTVTQP